MAKSQFSLTIPGRLEALAELAKKIDAHSAERNWPDGWAMKINVSLDELVTNVVSYGYGSDGSERKANATDRDIHISFTEQGDILKIEIEDDGIVFNTFKEVPEPDTTLSLEERPIGGLGIMLVKNFMDEVAWERVGKRNRITLTLRGLMAKAK